MSLWFGSSLRSKPRTEANLRTALESDPIQLNRTRLYRGRKFASVLSLLRSKLPNQSDTRAWSAGRYHQPAKTHRGSCRCPDLTSAFGGTADMERPAAGPGPVENDPGCVKTPQRATRVEAHRRNCASKESNHTAHRRLEAALEDCIFYIFSMYEFSHMG